MTAIPPTWAILVPTLGERRVLFDRLMAVLLPQLDDHPQVQVHAWHNDGSPPLPEIRQRMVERAGTDYVSFVDDDDLVADDYVAEIVRALAQWPDQVGMQVQCYSDGHPTAIAIHSLTHGGWRNDRSGGRYYRDISHINPMRREIAAAGNFRRAKVGRAEDRIWAERLRRSGLLKTEVVIDRVLYHYLYAPGASRWERPRNILPGGRSAVEHPRLSWSDHA